MMAFQRGERGRDGKVTPGLHFLPFCASVSISKAGKNALLTHCFPRPFSKANRSPEAWMAGRLPS